LLALEPDVLLLDEPTTDLDPIGRRDVLRVLDRVRASGRAIVLVEHDATALEDAHAVVLLHDGRVAGTGSPVSVLADVAPWRAPRRSGASPPRRGAGTRRSTSIAPPPACAPPACGSCRRRLPIHRRRRARRSSGCRTLPIATTRGRSRSTTSRSRSAAASSSP